MLFLRKGLWFWKKPLFFLIMRFSTSADDVAAGVGAGAVTGAGAGAGAGADTGSCFVGDILPLGGS